MVVASPNTSQEALNSEQKCGDVSEHLEPDGCSLLQAALQKRDDLNRVITQVRELTAAQADENDLSPPQSSSTSEPTGFGKQPAPTVSPVGVPWKEVMASLPIGNTLFHDVQSNPAQQRWAMALLDKPSPDLFDCTTQEGIAHWAVTVMPFYDKLMSNVEWRIAYLWRTQSPDDLAEGRKMVKAWLAQHRRRFENLFNVRHAELLTLCLQISQTASPASRTEDYAEPVSMTHFTMAPVSQRGMASGSTKAARQHGSKNGANGGSTRVKLLL